MAFRVKKSYDHNGFQIFIAVYLTLCVVFALFSLYVTFVNAFRSNNDIQKSVIELTFSANFFEVVAHNFKLAFVGDGVVWNGVWRPLINSVLVAFVGSFFDILLGAIIAYLFVYKDFKFKNLLFTLYISVMLLPSIMGMPILVPFVKNTLGLDNNFIGYLLPLLAGGQVGAIFLFRTFFGQQPKSVYEAAKVEGANDFKIFLKVTVPLALPIMLFHFVGTFSSLYNDFLWADLILREGMSTIMPAVNGVTELFGQSERGALYAIYVITSIPLMITTIISMRHFSSGDFAAGLKL